MGTYNRLHIDAACQRCGEVVTRVLQVKFGECCLHDYRLGDSVRWSTGRRGRAINHGKAVTGRAWVPAYAERPCPSCGADSNFAEFAAVLHGDQFIATVQAPAGFSFPEDSDVVLLDDDEVPSWRRDPERTSRGSP